METKEPQDKISASEKASIESRISQRVKGTPWEAVDNEGWDAFDKIAEERRIQELENRRIERDLKP